MEHAAPISFPVGIANETLKRQIEFLVEIDKLKGVLRRSPLLYAERRENSAEHSWHVATMAMLLAQYADEPVDVGRVMRMLLVHDIVEIDAGDTFGYDSVGQQDQAAREELAVQRIYGLLPQEQGEELAALWREFDAAATPEARFANAVDRLMPLLHNYCARGGSWQAYGVHQGQVLRRMAPIRAASESLWRFVVALLDDAVRQGFLLPAPEATAGQADT